MLSSTTYFAQMGALLGDFFEFPTRNSQKFLARAPRTLAYVHIVYSRALFTLYLAMTTTGLSLFSRQR